MDELNDNYDGLEQVKNYIDQSHPADLYEKLESMTDAKTEAMGLALLDSDTSIETKQGIISVFAHLGTIQAYRFLKKYGENPDDELAFWADMAMDECRMFLEINLGEGDIASVSSEIGEPIGAFNCNFIFLPHEGKLFNEKQKQIIEDEMFDVCRKFRCETSYFEFLNDYSLMTVSVPFDIAVATFAENLIKQCNEKNNFVLEHYYAGTGDAPDEEEIKEIIEIVREG